MCMSTTCPYCQLASWKGCGKHIPKAMSVAPKSEWCTCKHREDSTTPKEYPPMAGQGIPK